MAGKREGLYLHGRCHIEAPTWAIIRTDGQIEVVCAECDKTIIVLALKDPPKLGCSAPGCHKKH